jgi:hypothetical protein
LVWLSAVPLPDALSALNFKPLVFNDYMSFEPTCACIFFAIYESYYMIIEPRAAVSSDVVALHLPTPIIRSSSTFPNFSSPLPLQPHFHTDPMG